MYVGWLDGLDGLVVCAKIAGRNGLELGCEEVKM